MCMCIHGARTCVDGKVDGKEGNDSQPDGKEVVLTESVSIVNCSFGPYAHGGTHCYGLCGQKHGSERAGEA